LLGLVWRHRHRLLRWLGFAVRALPRAVAGDSSLLAELRLLAMLERDDRFPHVRVEVTDRTAHFTGLVLSAGDVPALEQLAARLGLSASVDRVRVRRRVGSRSSGGLVGAAR
jgi:hypothetical protein